MIVIYYPKCFSAQEAGKLLDIFLSLYSEIIENVLIISASPSIVAFGESYFFMACYVYYYREFSVLLLKSNTICSSGIVASMELQLFRK